MSLPTRLPEPIGAPTAVGPSTDRMVALVCLPAALVQPGLLVVPMAVLLVGALRRRLQARSARRVVALQASRDLPVVVSLLHIAAAAGHGPRAAVGLAGGFGWGAVGASLRLAGERLAHGVPFADALAVVASPRLVELLLRADEDGGRWASSLELYVADLHRERMAELEERTGRLTVTLLVPLVLCVLPALIVMAIVPVVGGALLELG